jgi:hypothetical protein
MFNYYWSATTGLTQRKHFCLARLSETDIPESLLDRFLACMKPASITYASFVLAIFMANRFDPQSVNTTIREGKRHCTGI